MSAIASTRSVSKSELMRAGDRAADVVAEHGRALATYRGSGYVLTTLLCYLDETRDIHLMKSELDAITARLVSESGVTQFALTAQHQGYRDGLAPERFDERELGDYYNELNESNEAGAGRAMADGIDFLRDALGAVNGDTVVILTIG